MSFSLDRPVTKNLKINTKFQPKLLVDFEKRRGKAVRQQIFLQLSNEKNSCCQILCGNITLRLDAVNDVGI